MDWVEKLVNVVRDFIGALLGYLGGSAAKENAAQSAALDTVKKADEVRSELSALSGDDARNQLHSFDRQ